MILIKVLPGGTLSFNEAMKELGINRVTIGRWQKKGYFKTARKWNNLWIIDEDEVKSFRKLNKG